MEVVPTVLTYQLVAGGLPAKVNRHRWLRNFAFVLSLSQPPLDERSHDGYDSRRPKMLSKSAAKLYGNSSLRGYRCSLRSFGLIGLVTVSI